MTRPSITLEITNVRVDRLQQISGMDAKHEGMSIPACMPQDGADLDWAGREFNRLWDKINGAGALDGNPWVWVIEFRRVDAVERVTGNGSRVTAERAA